MIMRPGGLPSEPMIAAASTLTSILAPEIPTT